jgi:ethanolamine-phosphate cytidylyltransferase
MQKKYFIDGCFDGYHYGHVNAIFQSKQNCDILVLATHSDIEMSTHKNNPVFTYKERLFMLQNCKYIDEFTESPVPYITKVDVLDEHNCSHYLHGDEELVTKNNEIVIQIPLERYITYKTTKGISTTNLLIRFYHYSTGVPIQQNNDYDYLSMIVERMKSYNIRHYTKEYKGPPVYLYHDWDVFCLHHIKIIKSIKNKYPDNKIILVIKPGKETIYNEMERKIILHSVKDVDDVILLEELGQIYEEIQIDLTDISSEFYFSFNKRQYILNIMDNYETHYKQKIAHLI